MSSIPPVPPMVDALQTARTVLNTRDVDAIRDHFQRLYTESVSHPRPEDLDEISAAAARLATLDDPAAAAFSGWLLLGIASENEEQTDV